MDKQKSLPNKNRILMKLLLALSLICIIIFIVLSIWPSWPTKARLCRDVEAYIMRSECLTLDDKFAILDRAFPVGSTSSEDVKNALGDYLHDKVPGKSGHIEIYYLSVQPMDYLMSFQDAYIFTYDEDGLFLGYIYED